MCNNDLKIILSPKSYSLTIPNILELKILEYRKCIFMNVEKKLLKHLTNKSFSAFGGVQWAPPNKLNLFWQNILLFILLS